MKMRIQVLLSTVLLLAGTLLAGAREYTVRGPQGGLAMTETLPDGFDPQTQKCPMVILMHGIISAWEFAKSLPYVSGIGCLGHSQGGVIASMVAGRLAERGEDVPQGVVLIAPGSIIKEACQAGRFS